jgi:hypothetical protein
MQPPEMLHIAEKNSTHPMAHHKSGDRLEVHDQASTASCQHTCLMSGAEAASQIFHRSFLLHRRTRTAAVTDSSFPLPIHVQDKRNTMRPTAHRTHHLNIGHLMLPRHGIAILTLLTAHPTRPLPINKRLVLPRNPGNKSLRRIACVTTADLVRPRQSTSLLPEAKQVLKTRILVEVIIRMKLAMAADAAHSFHQILPNTTSVDIHMMRHTYLTVNLLFHRDPSTTHPTCRIHCCGQGRDPRYLPLLV